MVTAIFPSGLFNVCVVSAAEAEEIRAPASSAAINILKLAVLLVGFIFINRCLEGFVTL
jgi:hypothetical protein